MMELPQEIRDRLNKWAWADAGPFDAHVLIEIVSAAYELGVEDGTQEAMENVGDWYELSEPMHNEGRD